MQDPGLRAVLPILLSAVCVAGMAVVLLWAGNLFNSGRPARLKQSPKASGASPIPDPRRRFDARLPLLAITFPVFAAALLHDPQVLVVDEPMVGLDPRNIRLVKDLLRCRASAGAAVFMSTHTLAIAEEICTRIGIIDRGRLLFTGTLPELRQEMYKHDSSLEQLFLELTEEEEQPSHPIPHPEDAA